MLTEDCSGWGGLSLHISVNDNDNSTKKHHGETHFQRGGRGSESFHHLPEAAELGREASEPGPRSVPACVQLSRALMSSLLGMPCRSGGHTEVWEQGAVCTPALSASGWLSDFDPSHLHPSQLPQPPVPGPYLLCTWGERILMLIAKLIVLIAKSII